jgi:molybdenum cofactor cytidylyltransferase
MGRIGAILLAAGGATRMGAPKQLLAFRGRSLLRHAAETALGVPLSPVIVVLGASADRLLGELDSLAVQVVRNDDWERGLGTSIRAGLRALRASAPDARAVVLMLCDQPLVGPELLRRLATAYEETGATVVASEYEGTLGVPALFDRVLFPELETLADGQGAKGVIAAAERVRAVPFPGGAFDVDTPRDYERLRSLAGG